MPVGWNYFYRNGNNLQIVNNRLEAGQVDSSGGVYRPFDPAGVSKVQIDYDANIANVFWGQSNAAMLLKNPTNLEAGYAYAGAAKSGFGQNTMLFYSDLQNPGAAYSRIISNVLPAMYGNYHISTSFQDGLVSLSVTPFGATTPIFSSGQVNAPGFQLSSMSNIALFGLTTTGTSAWIDNAVITTTTAPSTCTPPETLQNGVCVTLASPVAPSVLTLARLAEDAYNREKTGFKGDPISGFTFVGEKSEYVPIKYVAQVPALTNAGSTPAYVIPSTQPVKEDAVAINVYRNSADPHQYVIAVRGTDNAYNLVADASFLSGVANSELTKYSELLASKVASIMADDREASISLTGHSMGGAIAQVVAEVGGFRVVSFDAPGVGAVVEDLRTKVSAKLAGAVGPASIDFPVNYRLYGDQVSFAGSPLSTLVTKTVDDLASQSAIDSSLLPMGWLQQHDMPKLLSQLEKALRGCVQSSCPAIATSAAGQEGRGRDLTNQFVQIKATAKRNCRLDTIMVGLIWDYDYCKLLTILEVADRTGSVTVQNVLAGVGNAIDPGPGWLYSLEVDAGSAPIESVMLPIFGDVFGWALRFHSASGWTDDNIWMSDAAFLFPNEVDAFTFMPLGQDGKPIFNPDSFAYDLVFSQNGSFSAYQTNFGGLTLVSEIPEPGTVYLLFIGAAMLLLARRSTQAKKLRRIESLQNQ